MSRCDEYRDKIIETERKIRELRDWPTIYDDPVGRRRKIELLERQKEVLEDKYERSLRRGGC